MTVCTPRVVLATNTSSLSIKLNEINMLSELRPLGAKNSNEHYKSLTLSSLSCPIEHLKTSGESISQVLYSRANKLLITATQKTRQESLSSLRLCFFFTIVIPEIVKGVVKSNPLMNKEIFLTKRFPGTN